MGRLKSSWRLMVASLGLLNKRPGLLVLPAVSGTMILAVVAGLVGGVVAVMGWAGGAPGSGHEAEVAGWVRKLWLALLPAALVVYVLCSFIGTLFNAALVACVLGRLEGEPTTLREGLRLAWARRGAILGWSLLNSAVGAILSLVRERARSIPGRRGWLVGLLVRPPGAVWSLVTFLIVPVLVFEELPSLKEYLRRSAELFKRTWGEQIVGRISVGLAVALITLAGIVLVGGIAFGLSATLLQGHGIVISVVLLVAVGLLGVVGVVLSSALNGIYAAALYSYAVTGMLPQQFTPDLLPQPQEG